MQISVPTPCQLSTLLEKGALSYDSSHTVTAMASLVAPPSSEEATRAPLDIVAVVDKSGSMGTGGKMALMQTTLKMLIDRGGLNATDRFGLVSFDDKVKVEIPLGAMDSAGK